MAVTRELPKLPIKILRDQDIKPEHLQKQFQAVQDNFQSLDERRIAQQTAVSEGASDSETISNLLAAVNGLLAALNASSLTEG